MMSSLPSVCIIGLQGAGKGLVISLYVCERDSAFGMMTDMPQMRCFWEGIVDQVEIMVCKCKTTSCYFDLCFSCSSITTSMSPISFVAVVLY